MNQYQIYYRFAANDYSGVGAKIVSAPNSEKAIAFVTQQLDIKGYTLIYLQLEIYANTRIYN